MRVSLPMFPKGATYEFEHETAQVYRVDEKTGAIFEYPLRPGLAGYLWLLLYEQHRAKFLRKIY